MVKLSGFDFTKAVTFVAAFFVFYISEPKQGSTGYRYRFSTLSLKF